MDTIDQIAVNDPLQNLADEINIAWEEDEADDRELMERYEKRIRRAFYIGQKLIEAKAIVDKHGNWKKWVLENCKMKIRRVEQYMALAKYWDEETVLKVIKRTYNLEIITEECKRARMTPEEREEWEKKKVDRAAARAEKAAAKADKDKKDKHANAPSDEKVRMSPQDLEVKNPPKAKGKASDASTAATPSVESGSPPAPQVDETNAPVAPVSSQSDETTSDRQNNILAKLTESLLADTPKPELMVIEGGRSPKEILSNWCEGVRKQIKALGDYTDLFEVMKSKHPEVITQEETDAICAELAEMVDTFSTKVFIKPELSPRLAEALA